MEKFSHFLPKIRLPLNVTKYAINKIQFNIELSFVDIIKCVHLRK